MKIRFIEGSKRAVLLESEKVLGITIRRGFVFNGANIPEIVVSLVGLSRWHPKVRRAALLHDYLYSVGEKRMADEVFKRKLKRDGANWLQVQACYWAVRLFGVASK